MPAYAGDVAAVTSMRRAERRREDEADGGARPGSLSISSSALWRCAMP